MKDNMQAGKGSDRASFQGHATIEAHIQNTRSRLDSTLESLADLMSPDHFVNTLATPLGESGKALVKKAARSIQKNPMPIVVMAAGLAWFISANRSEKHRGRTRVVWTPERYGAAESDSWNSGDRSRFQPGASSYEARSGTTGDSGPIDHLSERISDAKDQVGDRLGQLGEGVSATMDRVREFASSTQETVSEKASRLAHGVERRMHGATETAAGMGKEASSLFKQYPIAMGAIGLALGSFIGSTLPRTAQEDELFGPHRDQLKESALRKASESAESIEDAVREGVSDAVKSAKQAIGADPKSPAMQS